LSLYRSTYRCKRTRSSAATRRHTRKPKSDPAGSFAINHSSRSHIEPRQQTFEAKRRCDCQDPCLTQHRCDEGPWKNDVSLVASKVMNVSHPAGSFFAISRSKCWRMLGNPLARTRRRDGCRPWRASSPTENCRRCDGYSRKCG
jgi:hypothetical protein